VRVVGDPPDRLEVDPEPEMDCVDVRDRLTEYALSLLPAPEVEPVERHLGWCAGCRKEAAELTGGAAAAGMSVAQAEPPAALEERLVREIREATGAGRTRSGRARSRTMIVIAATLAIFMGLGWWATFGDLQSSKQAQERSRINAINVGKRFDEFLKSFTSTPQHRVQPNDQLKDVQLTPELNTVGGGKAVIFLSHHRDDWVLVYVGGLDPKAGPYGATLQSEDGTVLPVMRAEPDNGGGVALFNQFPESLAKFNRIVVTDGRGHVVLTGSVTGASAAPTSVG